MHEQNPLKLKFVYSFNTEIEFDNILSKLGLSTKKVERVMWKSKIIWFIFFQKPSSFSAFSLYLFFGITSFAGVLQSF